MPETYTFARRPPEQEFAAIERQCRTSVDTILGRSTANGRALEEIPCTAAGRALLDDAAASDQRTTLGLGTAAVEDYTEGTFTPALSFGGGTTGITYGAQTGSYVRVGKLVVCNIRITLTNNGSSSGGALITGLPFTVWNNAGGRAGGVVAYYANLASLTDGVTAFTDPNTLTAILYTGGAATVTQLTEANITDTADIILTLSYRANS